MSTSTSCNITDNEICSNQIAGINLVDCTDNFLYHNIIRDNLIQNAADNGNNHWDAGAKAGGNYWSDHAVAGRPGKCAPPHSRPGPGSLSIPASRRLELMDELDLELLRVAQDGLELTERPYRVWGEVLGISEEEVIVRLQALEDEGIVRRFAATIGHRALGILANALIAWRVPPERVDEAGSILCCGRGGHSLL